MNERKSKVINIEWLFVNQDQYDLIMNDVSNAAKENYNTIIFIALLDGFMSWDTSYWLPLIEKIDVASKKLGIQEIIFISGAGGQCQGLKHKSYFYDLCMNTVKNAYLGLDKQIKDYTLDLDKFMFLTGRPARPNRIGLMSKLYEANLLDKGIWSFFPPWNNTDNEWCRNYLKKYNNTQYKNFLKDCEKSLDIDNEYNTCKTFLGVYEGDNWHKIADQKYFQNPTFIDFAHYDNVKISIISEGPVYWEWSADKYYLTDKAYREILMKKPILIAGYVEQYKQLQRLGFKTFSEYLLIKDYGFLENEDDRLDAIVKNVEHFLNQGDKHFNEIKKDVDFNSQLLYRYFKKQDNFLLYLKKEYNVSNDDIDFFFKQKGLKKLIQKP
jgi:hypothetical protein